MHQKKIFMLITYFFCSLVRLIESYCSQVHAFVHVSDNWVVYVSICFIFLNILFFM